MMQPAWRSLSLAFLLALACLFAAPQAHCKDVPPDKVFAAVPFDQWVKQGPVTAIPWKVQVQSNGLSIHQRMRGRIDVELQQRYLKYRPPDDRMIMLIQVTDAAGERFRDYTMFRVKDVVSDKNKGELDFFWNLYVVPGEYKVTIVLVDAAKGTHNLEQSRMHIEQLKNDALPGIWQDLPAVEFLAPHLKGPDFLFRPDITSRLHLPLVTKRPIELDVLTDVTASDLFHGSNSFYDYYLSVALPLLKALTQVKVERGSIDVAMLDLRHRRVAFEQNNVDWLDWPRARSVLAPENGPATIDIKTLEQKRESPAFLQDELLRRLNATPIEASSGGDSPTEADLRVGDDAQRVAGTGADPREAPLHVFVIIGSPMDFYSFRDLPKLPPGSEEKCVVYYLQFDLVNPGYADGAIGNVRKMLKPLEVHVFKVGTAESVRHALAKILEEVAAM